jgi:hypothetical protein
MHVDSVYKHRDSGRHCQHPPSGFTSNTEIEDVHRTARGHVLGALEAERRQKEVAVGSQWRQHFDILLSASQSHASPTSSQRQCGESRRCAAAGEEVRKSIYTCRLGRLGAPMQ